MPLLRLSKLFLLLSGFSLNIFAVAQDEIIDAALLHEMVKNNDVEELRLLANQNININALSDEASSLLYNAVKVGNLEMIRLLIEEGADVNLGNTNSGWTPLIRAVYDNRIDIMTILIEAGANPNKAKNDGWAPLHFTVNNRDNQPHDGRPLITFLLQHGADINQLTHLKQSALYLAISNQQESEATLLLSKDANPNLVRDTGVTPLMRAIQVNQLSFVEQLIKAGADVNQTDNEKHNALHYAVMNKEDYPFSGTPFIKVLLAAGANPNQQNSTGATPSYFAVTNGREEEISLLIKGNANVNIAEESGWSPLLSASYDHNLTMTKMLVDAGADVNYAQSEGWTALHLCVNSDNIDDGLPIINYLIDNGANVNLINANGSTPIMLAALNGQLDEYKALLKGNPDFKISRLDGKNLLHLAVIGGNLNIVVNALKHDYDVNLKDQRGWSVMHYVHQKENGTTDQTPVLSLLIDEGGDVSIPTQDGYTPLMIAAHFNRVSEARLLIKSGADLLAENPLDNNTTAQDYAFLARNIEIATMIGKAVRAKR